jgi:hypothetical protein
VCPTVRGLLQKLFNFRQAPDTDVANAPVEGLVFGFDTTFRVTALIAIASIILVTIIWWLEQRKVHNNRESACQ